MHLGHLHSLLIFGHEHFPAFLLDFCHAAQNRLGGFGDIGIAFAHFILDSLTKCFSEVREIRVGDINGDYKPDFVMLPIGGNFTMDHSDAAWALKNWIKPKMVIPMHYNSNPLTPGTVAEFQDAMKGSQGVRIVPMTEGQTVEF